MEGFDARPLFRTNLARACLGMWFQTCLRTECFDAVGLMCFALRLSRDRRLRQLNQILGSRPHGRFLWDACGFKSVLIRKAALDLEKARWVVVGAVRRARPDGQEILSAAESIRGHYWVEMCEGHGDWGRHGVAALATRHLG